MDATFGTNDGKILVHIDSVWCTSH
jgi:hypothetical protein